jgi:ribosome maturation protein SDO1
MTNTLARIKKAGKNFEIIVDLDNALKFKKGLSTSVEAEAGKIFSDSKRGLAASNADLTAAFGTNDVNEIAQGIVKKGEVLVTQEHRDEERDKKMKQVVDFIVTNSVDQNGRPYTPSKIKSSLEEAHVNIKNVPIENQIKEIMAELSKIIPIKLETKKVKITIPAIHTAKAYGIISSHKENEKWLNDGSLEVVVSVPAGILIDFYDKLNGVTHGSALTEEVME